MTTKEAKNPFGRFGGLGTFLALQNAASITLNMISTSLNRTTVNEPTFGAHAAGFDSRNEAPELFPQPRAFLWQQRPRVRVRRDDVEGHFSRPIRIPLISPAHLRSTFDPSVADHGTFRVAFEIWMRLAIYRTRDFRWHIKAMGRFIRKYFG